MGKKKKKLFVERQYKEKLEIYKQATTAKDTLCLAGHVEDEKTRGKIQKG